MPTRDNAAATCIYSLQDQIRRNQTDESCAVSITTPQRSFSTFEKYSANAVNASTWTHLCRRHRSSSLSTYARRWCLIGFFSSEIFCVEMETEIGDNACSFFSSTSCWHRSIVFCTDQITPRSRSLTEGKTRATCSAVKPYMRVNKLPSTARYSLSTG